MKHYRYSDWRIKALRTAAKASHYIAHIYNLNPCLVVLFIRVSGPGQREHLAHVEALLRWELERRGFEVVGVFKEIVTGSSDDRRTLERAILEADRLGAVLVAESADRFLRHPEFHPIHHPDLLPTVFDFERLMADVGNVQLATFHHPDMPWRAVRSEQTKRGQQGSGNRGGRPGRGPGWTKRRRELKMSEVLRLRGLGRSYREISDEVGIWWSTVRNWIKDNSSKIAHPCHSSEPRERP